MAKIPPRRFLKRLKSGSKRWEVARVLREKQQHQKTYTEYQKQALRAYLISIGKPKALAQKLAIRMLDKMDNGDAIVRNLIKSYVDQGGSILKRDKRGK